MLRKYYSSLFDRLAASKKLPLGHVERQKAQDAIDQIYNACLEQEQAFIKKLSKKLKRYCHLKDKRFIRRLVDHMCHGVGSRTVKALWWRSQNLKEGTGAHYSPLKQEIHFKWRSVSLTTVIHETTHHIQYREGYGHGHGADFCMLEKMLFSLAEQFLVNCVSYAD